jgi:tetratricopeptide (TPR) repeat protein
MWRGRFDEALRESERARHLDPLSLIIASDYGAILHFSRQYDPAIEQLRSVLQRYPNFGPAVGLLVRTYAEKGILTQALAHAETWGRVYGEGPVYWSLRAYAYGRAGHPDLARRELKKLEELSRHEQLDPSTMIWAHLGVNDKEEALADLERAYSQHFSLLTTLKVDPAFDPLRSDPRFQDLLRRVGLAN